MFDPQLYYGMADSHNKELILQRVQREEALYMAIASRKVHKISLDAT